MLVCQIINKLTDKTWDSQVPHGGDNLMQNLDKYCHSQDTPINKIKTEDFVSVIIPCYNEAKTLQTIYDALGEVAKLIPQAGFEFTFVDDGSKDKTLDIIESIASKDLKVGYIVFSRNFGKEAAMYAGMKEARGNLIAIMDADMQDPPHMLLDMYKSIKDDGYDCVAARRINRVGEPRIRSFFARRFYKLMKNLSSIEIVDGARDFRLMKREMVDAILSVSEYNRFSKGIFSWVGFKTKWLEYENIERVSGESKWSFWKLFLYSIDGIVAFSTAPLALSSLLGICLCFAAFLAIIFTVTRQLIWGGSAYGWSSLVCIILFLSGIQLFCIGILGQYLSKTYLESKKRPIYITRKQKRKNDE